MNENDDIEILDIFDEPRKIKKEVVSNIINNNEQEINNKTKKRKLKTKNIQILFCSLSALFILGCIVFYGLRFIKYYKIYNPKVDASDGSVLLARDISGKSEIVYEGDGLYISSGNYIYKGNVDNNYLKFNNMLWRILRINVDNSIELILDDYIALLPWNSEVKNFSESEIKDYLNNEFLNNLDKDYLAKVDYCEEKIDDLSKISCTNKNYDNYVKLLDITNFLNSVKNKKSYLVKDEEIFWLADSGSNKVWHTNSINVSQSDSNTFYEIRPVIKLKNTTYYTKGDGTKDNPYIVGEDKLSIGSVVKLGQDQWIVYNINKNVELMYQTVLPKTMAYDNDDLYYDKSALNKYLNGEYLESLSYKDKIISNDYYIGRYKSKLSDIKDKTVNVKVGIPNILDIKFNSNVNSFFTSTSNDGNIWVYDNPLRSSKVTTYRGVRPCITISKDYANKLKYHEGIWEE